VHVVGTSLDRTNFGSYVEGRRTNLERALRLGDRLGGHMVQGHVDGVGRVVSTVQRDDALLVDLRVPAEIARLAIPLGSIAVDGVSLTVNARPAGDVVQISLIPFTLQQTTLGERQAGDQVHLEADMLGKYVAALLESRIAVAPGAEVSA
jgi:riboflavin synthase